MHGTMLTCALVILMTGLIAMTLGNQGNNARYNRGEDCRFIYASLKYVCAQGAGITQVPSPCCITQVRYLELVGNPLTTLRKKEFSRRFSNLESMDLRNNQISHIQQGAFSGLRRVQILDLSGNRLTSLPDGIFKGLSSLTTLHLGGNGMARMSQGAFSGLPSLSVLRLDNNNLREIQEEAFEPLERLLSLYLNGNQLTTLQSESFSGLSRLQTLSLASNQLQTFPDILPKLPDLVQLILNSNPLICDCRVLFLQQWLAGHSGGQSRETVRCSAPPRFRGHKLMPISPRSLCQTDHHPPNTNGDGTSYVFQGYDESFSSATSVTHQGHGDSAAGGKSFPSAGSTTKPATANERYEQVFFDNIPGDSDHAIPPPLRPTKDPGVALDPGQGPSQATTIPIPMPKPTRDPERTGFVTPNPRPGLPPDGSPNAFNPNPSGQNPSRPRPPGRPPPFEPLRPTSGYGWPNQDTNHTARPGVAGGNGNSEKPAVDPGGPGVHQNGSSNSNGTLGNFPDGGATGSPNHTQNESGASNNKPGQPTDSGILTTLSSVAVNSSVIAGLPGVVGTSGEAGADGNAELPNLPLVIYGVDGQNVVLHCGTKDLAPYPRVKWLHPHGRPVTGLDSRFKLKRDGSLRIHPLRKSDMGSYRCIVRTLTSSRVILVRLRAACPCTNAVSFDGQLYYDDSSPESHPVPTYACSWTPLVIAVVTTFQGTIAACALAFCVWYTRCHRRKTFTIRVEEAERRDSKRLRNSDMSVLRHCSNSTVTSLTDCSRATSCEQGSLHPSDSLTTPRTSHTLSDYMNAYVTQQMRRNYQLGLPIPDYVDLDPNSRDPHETLYSSLRGRDFNNRRRRIVTQ
ncbi:leucine-rich repeat extensin-like protein 5 [Patiria miniata]|uniref:Ig-like domain-containing protein n=1 Tax=Patiria miniata TaxID=46514 RepID=A0A913ZKL9_PATMI|nr:leucine-rich repeat extensin-like protein 5 [Patiria miniata]